MKQTNSEERRILSPFIDGRTPFHLLSTCKVVFKEMAKSIEDSQLSIS